MNPRERIKNAMDFRPVDSVPWAEVFDDVETMNLFLLQGLPAHEVIVYDWGIQGMLINNWKIAGLDPSSYFDCINLMGYPVPVDLGPIPRFKYRKVAEDSRYREYVMPTGARCRYVKRDSFARETLSYSMPMFSAFPVTDRKSWDQYKCRLNPEDPRRYPQDWERESWLQAFREYEACHTVLAVNGFYGFGAQLMGIPNFNLAFYRNPELIRDMLSHWEYFTIEATRDAVETLKDSIDVVFWWEDMAERHGPNISPKLYREFLLPHYKQVTGFFKKNGINIIMMDSDGNTVPILDLVIEAGITGHLPLEVNSGMDVRTLRKRFGKQLFFAGNLDKREIAKGDDAMRREIDSKLPLMKESGGYIAGLDHSVPAFMTLDTFKEYAQYLKKKLPVNL
jgi:uroporphyrinogen decarboxylase